MCAVVSGTRSLVFVDDVNTDGSSRMNLEVYRALLSADIQPNAEKLIGQRFTVQKAKHQREETRHWLILTEVEVL